MEFIIAILVVGGLALLYVNSRKKAEANERHPLDAVTTPAPYKVETPVVETPAAAPAVEATPEAPAKKTRKPRAAKPAAEKAPKAAKPKTPKVSKAKSKKV